MMKEKLINLINDFNKDNIIDYKLLSVIIGEIIADETLSLQQKQEYGDILNEFLINNKMIKVLTIKDLNIIFDTFYDINDINNYILLFNIITEEFQCDDENISLKIKDLIFNLLNEISAQEIEPIEEKEEIPQFIPPVKQLEQENHSINNFISDNFDDINISNKSYLTEYVRAKNLIPYQCKVCGLSEWQNEPLLLILDSISGIYSNHNINDLRFLCPNCYSQIGNFN